MTFNGELVSPPKKRNCCLLSPALGVESLGGRLVAKSPFFRVQAGRKDRAAEFSCARELWAVTCPCLVSKVYMF